MRQGMLQILRLIVIGIAALLIISPLGTQAEEPDLINLYLPLIQNQDPPAVIASRRALVYLNKRYNETVGLLNESSCLIDTRAEAQVFTVNPDNRISWYVAFQLKDYELAGKLSNALLNTYYEENGLHENTSILTNDKIETPWPPSVSEVLYLGQVQDKRVFSNRSNREKGIFHDYEDYADLIALGAIKNGNNADGQAFFRLMLEMYDSYGLHDKAFSEGRYETYKLALLIHAAYEVRLQSELPISAIPKLLSLQDSDGGFPDIYGDELGCANTLTTAYAGLALISILEE